MQQVNSQLRLIKNDYCKRPDARRYPDIIPWHIKVMYLSYFLGEEVFSGADRLLDPYNLKSYHAENY